MSAASAPILSDESLDVRDRLTVWTHDNPLRQHRRATGLAVADVANLLGVNMSTVYTWEWGTATPTGGNWVKLARLMKLPLADLENTWAAWKVARPSV